MKHECSLGQWVSVYYDNEMDPQYREKMKNHIAVCAECSKRLEEYKEISLSLAPSDDLNTESAGRKVLQKLETGGFYPGSETTMAWRAGTPSVWKRRVSLPVPAAVAAAVLIVLAISFLLVRSPGKPDIPNMAITADTEILPDVIPFSGMESVMQYLGGTDTGDILILRLPENRNFSSYGEPAIIKTADYTRSAPKGRK